MSSQSTSDQLSGDQRAAERQLAGDQIRLAHSVLANFRQRQRQRLGVSRSGRRERLVRLSAVTSSGGRRTS